MPLCGPKTLFRFDSTTTGGFSREQCKPGLHLLASVLYLFTYCRRVPVCYASWARNCLLNVYSPRYTGPPPSLSLRQAPLLPSCLLLLPVPSGTGVNLSHVNIFCRLLNNMM